MGDIPGTYDVLYERRARASRNFIVSVILIVFGVSFFLTVPLFRMLWLLMAIPTFLGGYAGGQFARNWIVERLVDEGYETEDADIYGVVGGVVGGFAGCFALAAAQVLVIVLVVGLTAL
jgi:hypothetical protein